MADSNSNAPKSTKKKSYTVWYTVMHPTANPEAFAVLMLIPLFIAFILSVEFGSRIFNVYFLPVLFIILISLAVFTRVKSTKTK